MDRGACDEGVVGGIAATSFGTSRAVRLVLPHGAVSLTRSRIVVAWEPLSGAVMLIHADTAPAAMQPGIGRFDAVEVSKDLVAELARTSLVPVPPWAAVGVYTNDALIAGESLAALVAPTLPVALVA